MAYAPTPEQARAELARRELARRELMRRESSSKAAEGDTNWSEELPRTIGQIGGGIIGGVVGGAAGLPVGMAPVGAALGAAGGAGIGRATAEGIIQANKKIAGEETPDIAGNMARESRVGVLSEMGGRSIGPIFGGTMKALGNAAKQGWLKAGVRASKGATEQMEKKGWSQIKSLTETPQEAAKASSAAADSVDNAIKHVKKVASDEFGEAVRSEGEKLLPKPQQAIQDLYRHLWKDRLIYNTSGGQTARSGIAGLEDKLLPIARNYIDMWRGNGYKMNVQEAREVFRRLNDLIGDQSVSGEVRYAARVFKESVEKSMSQASPKMAQTIASYRDVMGTIDKSSKLLKKEGDEKVFNPQRVSKFFKEADTMYDEQQALQAVENLPGSPKFMEGIKDAAALSEYSPATSLNRGISMMGLGVAGMGLASGNPALAGAVAAGEAFSSPRLAAYLLGSGNRIREGMSRTALAKWASKPAVQAVEDIMEQFGVGNRLKGAALGAMMDEEPTA